MWDEKLYEIIIDVKFRFIIIFLVIRFIEYIFHSVSQSAPLAPLAYTILHRIIKSMCKKLRAEFTMKICAFKGHYLN